MLIDKYGYQGTINAVWEEARAARPNHPSFNDPASNLSRLADWVKEYQSLLADIPLAMLKSMLDGVLSQKACASPAKHAVDHTPSVDSRICTLKPLL